MNLFSLLKMPPGFGSALFGPAPKRKPSHRSDIKTEQANHRKRYPVMRLHPRATKRSKQHWRQLPRDYGTKSKAA